MEITSSDLQSPLKTGPDNMQIIPFEGGHLTFSSIPWIILAMTKDTEQLSTFHVQVQNLSKNGFKHKLNHFNWRTFSDHFQDFLERLPGL